MELNKLLEKGLFFCDGSTGAVLQSMGLQPGQEPAEWNITCPEKIVSLHKAYFLAGCHMVNTNTFSVTGLKYGDVELSRIITAAVNNAKEAARQAAEETGRSETELLVALDIGPTGKLMEPYGDLDFDTAVKLFSRVAELGAAAGADFVNIETMTDMQEARAAVLGVKSACSLPVFASCSFDAGGRMLTGGTPETAGIILSALGVDAVGINCGLGPEQMAEILPRLVLAADVPVLACPNAGLPQVEDGRTVYKLQPESFAAGVLELVDLGAACVGGCCGAGPEHIKAMIEKLRSVKHKESAEKKPLRLCGLSRGVTFDRVLSVGDEECDVLLVTGEDMEDCQPEAEPVLLYSGDLAALESAMRAVPGRGLAGPVTEENKAELSRLCKKYGCLPFAENEASCGVKAVLKDGKLYPA